MPDYSIVKSLCEELDVTIAELMDGEMSEEKSVRTYDDEQILDLLRRTQELEKQKNVMHGVLLIVMGIALQALSYGISGSNVKDFISGLLLGLSIAEMLVGVHTLQRSFCGLWRSSRRRAYHQRIYIHLRRLGINLYSGCHVLFCIFNHHRLGALRNQMHRVLIRN